MVALMTPYTERCASSYPSPKDRLPKKRSLLFKQLLVLYRHGPNDNHKLASCLSFLLKVRSFLHLCSFF